MNGTRAWTISVVAVCGAVLMIAEFAGARMLEGVVRSAEGREPVPGTGNLVWTAPAREPLPGCVAAQARLLGLPAEAITGARVDVAGGRVLTDDRNAADTLSRD